MDTSFALAFFAITYSSVIFSAAIASLVIFLLSFREEGRAHDLHASVLRLWSLAFFLWSWVRIPTVAASFGIEIAVSTLTVYYSFAFLARVAAYILFYLGMAKLVTNDSHWLRAVPLGAFLFFLIAIPFFFFATHLSPAQIGNIFRPFHYAVIVFLVAGSACFLFGKKCVLNLSLSRTGLALFALGWILFVVTDIQLARGYSNFPVDLWFVNLVSAPLVPFGFTAAHVLILLGIIVLFWHSRQSSK